MMTDAVQLPPDKIKGDALPKNITTRRDCYIALVRQVAKSHGVPLKAILKRDRTPLVAAARQDAYCALFDVYRLPKSHIGRLFKRDHTTVIHGIRQARLRRELA